MQENVPLKPYTTLKLGGTARYLFNCKKEEDLVSAVLFAKSKNLKVFPLGGGSNIVVSDELGEMVCIKMENTGVDILEEDSDNFRVRVRAGEDWDAFVGFTTERNISGLEALSGIPGTVGASPIQNIGAYGTEVSKNIESVRGYNIDTGIFENISSKDCDFTYRDSVFKNKLKGKFIVESVIFKLSKKIPEIPKYPLVDTELKKINQDNKDLTLTQQIRLAVKKIRSEKLPDPNKIPNVGSFFKNVFVSEPVFLELSNNFSDLPVFKEGDKYKIPAGWMIEKVGYKGYKGDGVGVHENHALVLINFSSESTKKLLSLADEIKSKVYDKFGLKIEIEPEIIT